MIPTLAIFVLVVVLAGGWGWITSQWVLHGEREPLTTTPRTLGLPFHEESFPSKDGVELKGWFVPSPSGGDALVVLCHGWGANRSNILERTHFLASRGGYSLFYFDFRNHGESGAARSSFSRHEIGDVLAAIDHVRSRHPAQAGRIGLFGMSMGAAVALWVSANHPAVSAVAAESSYTRFREALVRHARLFYHAPRPLAWITYLTYRWRLGFDPDDYSPLAVMDRISPKPVFLLQGAEDRRAPVYEGERLFAAAREPKGLWTLPGAGHGQLAEVAGRDFQDRLIRFFDDAFRRGPR